MATKEAFAKIAFGAAECAASVAGVALPGASYASSVVAAIYKSTEQVSIHRVRPFSLWGVSTSSRTFWQEKCQALANKCTRILDTIQELNAPDAIQNEEVRAALDSVMQCVQILLPFALMISIFWVVF